MNRLLPLLAVLASIAMPLVADDAPVAGRFCVMETKTAECRATTGATLVFRETETAGKLFTWTRSDEQLVIAGAIPKAKAIDLEALTAGTVGLPVVIKAAKSVTVRPPIAFALVSREKNWRWQMAPAVVNRKAPVLLRLAPGEYSLTITPSRLLPLDSGKFEVKPSAHDLAAREFYLRDLPAVRGVVLSASSRTPLRDVKIASEGVLLATTGADGRFQYSATKSGYASLEFSRSGYATHFETILVPSESTEINPVLLDKGATIRVEVKSDGLLEGVTADLIRIVQTYEKVRSTPVARFATFERVESGDYIVVLNGSGPLEHLATKLTADPGASLVDGVATIKPVVLSGSIHLGDSPLGDAVVTVQDTALYCWSGSLRTQPDGTFSETVWDRGFHASIVAAPLVQAYHTSKRIRSDFDAFWDIVIPAGRIRGRVFDKESGQPVAGATLRYVCTDATGRVVARSMRIGVGDDGTFVISPAPPGNYVIDVNAVGYVAPDSFRVSMGDSSPSAAVDIPLAKVDRMTVQVSRPDGEVVPNVLVLTIAADNHTMAAPPIRTDGFGKADITRPGAGMRLFALSPAGPWAEFPIPPDSDPAAPVRVALPRCDVRLHIRTLDVDGHPISGALFFVRYNGSVIPVQVWSLLGDLRSVPSQTNSYGETTFPQMPAGTYELIPFVNQNELRKAAMQKKWPAEASLSAGDAELTLVFEKAD